LAVEPIRPRAPVLCRSIKGWKGQWILGPVKGDFNRRQIGHCANRLGPMASGSGIYLADCAQEGEESSVRRGRRHPRLGSVRPLLQWRAATVTRGGR
jgi:hypothetical protein